MAHNLEQRQAGSGNSIPPDVHLYSTGSNQLTFLFSVLGVIHDLFLEACSCDLWFRVSQSGSHPAGNSSPNELSRLRNGPLRCK